MLVPVPVPVPVNAAMPTPPPPPSPPPQDPDGDEQKQKQDAERRTPLPPPDEMKRSKKRKGKNRHARQNRRVVKAFASAASLVRTPAHFAPREPRRRVAGALDATCDARSRPLTIQPSARVLQNRRDECEIGSVCAGASCCAVLSPSAVPGSTSVRSCVLSSVRSFVRAARVRVCAVRRGACSEDRRTGESRGLVPAP